MSERSPGFPGRVASLFSTRFAGWLCTETRIVATLSVLVLAYLAAAVLGGTAPLNALPGGPVAVRIILCAALLLPIGVFLGGYFPLGLKLVGARFPEGVVWA